MTLKERFRDKMEEISEDIKETTKYFVKLDYLFSNVKSEMCYPVNRVRGPFDHLPIISEF